MPTVDLNSCLKCFACISACPNNLISESPKGPKFDSKKSCHLRGKLSSPQISAKGSKCTKCGRCATICPVSAIKV